MLARRALLATTNSLTLWTPAQISTALWLDASDSSTVTTVSGAVSQWNDKSGNANHASQATAGSRPTYTTSGLNGLNVVTFSSGPFLNSPSLLMTGDNWTAISVLSMSSSIVDNYARYLSAAKSGAADYQDANSWAILNRRSGGNMGTEYNSSATSFAVTTNVPLLVSVTRSLASGNAFLNGTQVITRGSAASGLNTTGGARIGRSLNPSFEANEKWAGYSAEIIILQGMTTTTRQLLEGYLAWKWGLTANLPAGHPYKSAAPTA